MQLVILNSFGQLHKVSSIRIFLTYCHIQVSLLSRPNLQTQRVGKPVRHACSHPTYKLHLKQSYFCLDMVKLFSLFLERGNLSSLDLGDPRALLYWRGCQFESTPNSTGQGALCWGINWQRKPEQYPGQPGQHSGIHKKDNNQFHRNQITYKVFAINKNAGVLSVPPDKQLSHLAVGHAI